MGCLLGLCEKRRRRPWALARPGTLPPHSKLGLQEDVRYNEGNAMNRILVPLIVIQPGEEPVGDNRLYSRSTACCPQLAAVATAPENENRWTLTGLPALC